MKLVIRRILNLMLYLSFCVMAGTGLLMAFRLIPVSRGGGGLEVLGWNRHQWGDLHTWVSYLFILLIVIHLAINWLWLLRVAAQGRIWRLALGLLVGIAIIGAFFFLPVKDRRGQQGRGHRQQHSAFIESVESLPSKYLPVSLSSGGSVTFQKDIQPIMEASCISCHGPKRPKAGFRADLLASFSQGNGNGPLVVPGKSSQSRFLGIVSGTIKLKGDSEDHLLPAKEIALIQKWIDAGAH